MNRKGITPVISVVLLLMMTVAVAGIAWFWITGMTDTLLEEKAGAAIKQEVARLSFDISIPSYVMDCNVTQSVSKSANDGKRALNITFNLRGKSVGIDKTELETITITSVAVDGNVIATGDYLASSENPTIQSGEITQIVFQNAVHNSAEGKYVKWLAVNETAQDAVADNPMHWEDVEVTLTTDKETSVVRNLRLDANKKCI